MQLAYYLVAAPGCLVEAWRQADVQLLEGEGLTEVRLGEIEGEGVQVGDHGGAEGGGLLGATEAGQESVECPGSLPEAGCRADRPRGLQRLLIRDLGLAGATEGCQGGAFQDHDLGQA